MMVDNGYGGAARRLYLESCALELLAWQIAARRPRWSDPDLRRRVSILPQPLLAAPIPSVIAGAVASVALVHFDPQQRANLWALLSNRLSPTGRAVLEVQCPVAQDMAEARIASAQVW